VKIERSGTDSATVQAAFDGGGGAGNPARYALHEPPRASRDHVAAL
jgi:hypothetical protein